MEKKLDEKTCHKLHENHQASNKPAGINEIMAENQELRDLCCFLDDEIQRCRKLAHEWQSFGKYTAAVLRHEVLGFESKIQILTEKLQKLSQENAELRDLCLFLNQMAGPDSIQQPKLIPPQVDQYSVHAACVMDLSKSQALDDVPQYTGFTGKESIVDKSHKIVQNPNNGSGHQATTCTSVGDISTTSKSNGTAINDYVSKLEKRLEKIEMEKLELVKSLSAAHFLTTSNERKKDIPTSLPQEAELNEPPNIKDFLEYIKTTKGINNDRRDSDSDSSNELSIDDIMKLTTLIDISKRLDAVETGAISDREAKEIATLRMLITVAFKQMNERNDQQKKDRNTSSVAKTSIYPLGTIIQTEL